VDCGVQLRPSTVLVAVEFWYGSAAIVTTFYRVKLLSHNNNDYKLIKLQSNFNFEEFLLLVL